MNFSLKFLRAKALFYKRRSGIYDALAFSLEHDAKPAVEFRDMYRTARQRKSPLSLIYKHWIEQLRGKKAAGRISIALSDTIPNSELALLASAEKTLQLAQGFRFLAATVRKIDEMANAIIKAIRKIILPSIMIVVLMFFIDGYFFPSIEDSLPKKDWPFITKVVAAASHEISGVVVIGGVLTIGFFCLWYWSLSNWTGKFRHLAEKILLWGKYRDFQCTLFLVNLSFLMMANNPPRASLNTIYDNSNKYMKWHVKKMSDRLNADGSNVGDAIISTGLFNQELGDLMANYARWGDWHTQIRKIADTALEVTTRDLTELGPKLETFLNFMIGMFVITIFASGGAAILKVVAAVGFH